MNRTNSLAILCAATLVGGCASPGLKSWHTALHRPIEHSVDSGEPPHTTAASAERPPRGPDTDWAAIQRIRVGARAEDIHKITGQIPFYAGDYAFLTTDFRGQTYEVAFRYAPDGSGRIIDISFMPVTEAEVKSSRGTTSATPPNQAMQLTAVSLAINV